MRCALAFVIAALAVAAFAQERTLPLPALRSGTSFLGPELRDAGRRVGESRAALGESRRTAVECHCRYSRKRVARPVTAMRV
jgi:hypothetical protein